MKRWIAGVAMCLIAGEGQAGVLHCSFTEPFFTVTFDSATGKVTWLSADVFDENGKLVPEVLAENAKLEPAGPSGEAPSFVLKSGSEIILKLLLNGQGNDGMSENRFPFQAWYNTYDGGCDTEKYPSWDFYYVLEDLGVQQ